MNRIEFDNADGSVEILQDGYDVSVRVSPFVFVVTELHGTAEVSVRREGGGTRRLWKGHDGGSGKPVDVEALDKIAELLDGKVWSPEDLNEIADLVRYTGREIRDPEDVAQEQA